MLENSYGKEQKVVVVNKSGRYAWIGTAVSTFAEKIYNVPLDVSISLVHIIILPSLVSLC
jgi:hypothetical protein